MNGLVSVVIPAYNASAFIEECLDSVLKQTYENFEIVVVNDGSKDNTLDILKSYAEKDSRIRVFSKENGGVSSARNTALDNIKGEYVTNVDADDTMPENALYDMVSLMTDDVDFVIASHNEIRFKKMAKTETPKTYTKDEILNNFIEYDSVNWWPWGKLYRADIIQKNALRYDVNTTFGEDHIFNLLYTKCIENKVVVTDKLAYDYYFIRGGICSKYYPNMHEMQKLILLGIADFFDGKDNIPYEYKSYFTGRYIIGRIKYYCTWLPFSKAVRKVEETFDVYSDFLTDSILSDHFTEKQVDLIKKRNFKSFLADYIIKNPRDTVISKARRNAKTVIEYFQKKIVK